METPPQSGVSDDRPLRVSTLWGAGDVLLPSQAPAFLSASVICANPLHVGQEIRLLEEGGIDLLHIDVMDGHFVPRLGLTPELVKAIRGMTTLPIDVHLMVADPERYIPSFVQAGADIVVVHAEATTQLPRLLAMIRRLGARPGVALNPATPPGFLPYVLDDVDLVLLMAVNPGSVGERLVPSAMRKIADVHSELAERAKSVHIMIDGHVSLDNAPEMVCSGATILVCGSSSVFKQRTNVRDGLLTFRRLLLQEYRDITFRRDSNSV